MTGMVIYKYFSKATGNEVSERWGKANWPELATRTKVNPIKKAPSFEKLKKAPSFEKAEVAPSINAKAKLTRGQLNKVNAVKVPEEVPSRSSVLTEVVYVDGLYSSKSYLVFARVGSSYAAVRNVSGELRVHLYPSLYAFQALSKYDWKKRQDYVTHWFGGRTFKDVHTTIAGIKGVKIMSIENIAIAFQNKCGA